MNRKITRVINYILDEFIPSVLRDNRFLMFPLFFLWFKGRNVLKLMEFKSYFHKLSEAEFKNIYNDYHKSIKGRVTDLHDDILSLILKNIGLDKQLKIVDIGCGSGYLLKQLKDYGYNNLHGVDIVDEVELDGATYYKGNIEKLVFEDDSFDVVICSNTLEHVRELERAVLELKRITKNKLIVTVPCQKYFRYTFDLHINFFPQPSFLEHKMKMDNAICKKLSGDLFFLGYP